jgi:hypothetical protein
MPPVAIIFPFGNSLMSVALVIKPPGVPVFIVSKDFMNTPYFAKLLSIKPKESSLAM